MLVSHEDHEGNIARTPIDLVPDDTLDVVEPRGGTGRITRTLAETGEKTEGTSPPKRRSPSGGLAGRARTSVGLRFGERDRAIRRRTRPARNRGPGRIPTRAPRTASSASAGAARARRPPGSAQAAAVPVDFDRARERPPRSPRARREISQDFGARRDVPSRATCREASAGSVRKMASLRVEGSERVNDSG